MKTLHWMITRLFLPIFLLAVLFFVLVLELVDFFGNLWGYLSNDVSLLMIALSVLYYLPKCLSYALPIALLFASSFTLGSLYANNELIAIFGSGVPLARLVMPLLLIGLLMSAFSFVFQEDVVIDTFKHKNELTQEMLQRRVSYSNTNVTVLSGSQRVIYHADFFNDQDQSLSGLIIIERDPDGGFLRRIDARAAQWTGDRWRLSDVRIYSWDKSHAFLVQSHRDSYVDTSLDVDPATFRRTVNSVDEMKVADARAWIQGLKRAGLPYRADLTDFYNRFAFALTCLIVTFLSTAIGGRLRKNILLMSLLSSLVISVLYYVTQMMAILLAKLGYISPLAGAWGAVILFSFAGLYLFRVARS